MAKKNLRELECILTQEEKGLLGIKACEERDKARELKEQAAALEKSAKEKEHQVAQGKAKRQVEVVERKDFNENEVRIERTDERIYWPDDTPVVERRQMTGEERQTVIAGMGAPAGEPVATKAPAKRSTKKGAN